MRTFSLLLGSAALLLTVQGAPLEYRFTGVKSKVLIDHQGTERRAATGDVGLSGDGVRTGWWGRAVVEVPERASRFEIFPSTHATLADSEPGVLIVLRRGRLKAIFDALTGNQERLVATPGALLAVRGTRYGVEVAADGNAAVAVFEGTVEVRPRRADIPSLIVQAGQLCRFGPEVPPRTAPLPRGAREDDWQGGLTAPGNPPGAPGGPGGVRPDGPPQPAPGGRGQRGGGRG